MANEVKQHKSAVAFELFNEPMSIDRKNMFNTWRAVAEAVLKIIPDISIAVADTGEGAVYPAWISKYITAGFDIDSDTIDYMKASSNMFYAWHYYGNPKTAEDAVKNAQAIGDRWNMPTYATEFYGCDAWVAAKAANISHSYWHYSAYCTTGPAFGNKHVPDETFGACILGWGGGESGGRWENCSSTH